MQEFITELYHIEEQARAEQTDWPWERDYTRGMLIFTVLLAWVVMFVWTASELATSKTGQSLMLWILIPYSMWIALCEDLLVECPLTIGSEVRIYALLKEMPIAEYEALRANAHLFLANKIARTMKDKTPKLIAEYIVKKEIQR
jgi:hypothetical protein